MNLTARHCDGDEKNASDETHAASHNAERILVLITPANLGG